MTDAVAATKPDDATEPLARVAARVSVALHVGLFAAATPVALLSAIPPVSVRWLLPVLALLAMWTVGYTRVALRSGLLAWLVAADIAVTASVNLLIGQVVPVDRVDGGSSWVGVLATTTIVSTQLAWSPWASVPAGLVIVASYVVGSRIAGSADGGVAHGIILFIQIVVTAAVMVVLRRARRAADAALVAGHEAARAATVDQARREDERAQLRLLHDTALATLTMVGCGAIAGASDAMRSRVAGDLAVVGGLAAARDDSAPVRLDEEIATVAREVRHHLVVRLTLMPCEVPAGVGDAFARSVGEALNNVARHAGVGVAQVRLHADPERVVAEVVDEGQGFDPAAVATHRYGVRESIVARIAAAGGGAHLDTAPGGGTRWTLEWFRG